MLSHVSLCVYAALCAFFPIQIAEKACNSFTPVAHSSGPSAPPPCLSGIINDYTPVLGFGCDSSSLQVGTLSGFAVGDKVLLLQMQVPQVDLSNTATFGALLSATCIGNYEFNRIQSLGGNTIQLKYSLTRPYDISGKVQLVRVPEYDSASVCNLTCLPWNGTVGGVLALDIKTQITLNGDIDVSGKGFRGGIVENNIIPWVFGEQQYFYPPQSTVAAQKGEGIVFIPIDQSFGRGRAGNGGGGGNAHNGGGGGGANAGAGGEGGLEITDLPALPTPNTNGIGGARYFDTDAYKVLLGGGAGAGHANDSRGSSGGNGGGIVFLTANALQTNNFRVLANGIDVFGGAEQNDGQGGGGGGGTIVLKITQITGILNCELKGGRGGSNPYTPAFQLHGPGGGGGGGKLLLTQGSPNITAALLGGINGLTSQNLTNGATPGQPGKMLTGFVLPEGTALSHPVSNSMILSLQSPPCQGASDGQIAILQSTALAFRLDGGAWQPDSIFPNLTPGLYHIGLQFSGGCTLDTTATLSAAPPVVDSLLLLTHTSCISGGGIVVTAVSGNPPFEFQLNNAPWQSSGSFTGLMPGNYVITLRDAAGCIDTNMYSILAPPPARDTLLMLTEATCITGGQIAVAPVSGTGPFQFQLNSQPGQASGLFDDLLPGDYIISLTDAAGCTDTGLYTIHAPPPLVDSLLSQTLATCISGGSLQVQAISGTAPFEYQLDNGLWQSTGVFGSLAPANYQVTLRDAAGCTQANHYAIAATPPVDDSLLVLKQATCVLGGEISVAAIGGTAPFEFQLNGGAWQTGGSFANLIPGNYTVTVRDAAGCTRTHPYAIATAPPASIALQSLTDATCVDGGNITVNGVTGTPPFVFQLNGNAWQPNGIFEHLSPGNYTVTMSDAAGCTHTGTYTIQAPPPAQDSLLAIIDATCLTGGMAAVIPLSGTAPFTFKLNGGPAQSSGAFSGLTPGHYTVTMDDAAGCTHSNSFLIQPPPPANFALLSLSDATCIAGGALSVQPSSGSAPYEFQLNGGPWQTAGTFADLPAGNYVVTLRDGAGCTNSNTFIIHSPPVVNYSLMHLSHATCIAGGEITVQAVSGTGPFEYQLNGGPWQPAGDFTPLIPGNYTITVRDANGCTHSNLYQINPPPPLQDSLIALHEIGCDALGDMQVAATSGTPPFQFQLNNSPWQSTGFFNNLSSGQYLVSLRDAAGCTNSLPFSIAPYEPLHVQLDSVGPVDCTHDAGFMAFSATGGAGHYTFQLVPGFALQSQGFYASLPDGKYDILVADSAGCKASLNGLLVPNQVDTALTYENVTLYEGGYFELPDGRRIGRPGEFPFQYRTTKGCDSLHIIIIAVLKRHIYVPNVFSPGEDGQNDFFTIYSDASLEKVELLRIYDRWGELVFSKEDFPTNVEESGWDGRFRGRPVNPGVFVWFAKLKFVDGLEEFIKGEVTVVR